MKKISLIIFLIIGTIFTSYSQINKDNQLKNASSTAVIWFNNVNSGLYLEAWEILSLELKGKFNSNDWVLGMDQIMKSFGEFNGRIEIFRNFMSNPSEIDPMLVGFPDGYYAEFQYESYYKHTLNHSERLILHQDHKRKWRILDYSYEFVEGEGYSEEMK